jgi:hypothetical protein
MIHKEIDKEKFLSHQKKKEYAFEQRLKAYKLRDENEEIIDAIRGHYTKEQIANKEYLQNTTPYKLRDITKEIEEGLREEGIRKSLYVNSDLKDSDSERQFWYFERQLSTQAHFIVETKKELELVWDRINELQNGV